MPRKNDRLRGIDLAPPLTGGGSVDSGAVDDVLPPANPTSDAPIGLSLSTGVVYSSASPQSYINATWGSVGDVTPSFYMVQVSTSSSFTASGTITAQQPGASAHIEGLAPGTLYYVRVRAVAGRLAGEWSDTESITTATDTAPAGVPTSPLLTWIGIGDALITWTEPTEANFKDVVITVRAASGGTILGPLRYSSTGRFLYTLAMNLADTAGAGDSSLYVELQSRTYANVLGTKVNTGLVTKSAPATPASLTHTWSGDTAANGLAGAGWTLKWTRANDAARYRLTLDSVVRTISGNADSYDYPLALNTSEHSGTPDPVLTYSLVAVDGFGQSSAAAAGTATNEEPPTTAIAIAAGFSALAASATPSTVADFRDYTFRVILDGVTQATYRSTSPDQIYKADVSGSYTVGVKVNDLFGQASTETISSAVVLDALTIDELRSELSYTSSDGQSDANLNKLKDGDTSATATTHSASAVTWLDITAMRPLFDRYGQITLFTGGIAAGTLRVYFGLSADGVNFTWLSGPLTATGGTGQSTTLTAYGVEANAQTNAITVAAVTAYRFDLPTLTEARFIAIKHRNTTGNYTLREYYPRRLLQTDDFQAESVMAINIGADQVLANHISVISLAAIVVDTGALNISGVLSIGASGGIYQGTGSFASPTTGLKLYNSSGVGRLAGYNATVEQVAIDTDGKLKGAAGKVYIDVDGISVEISTAIFANRSYRLVNSSGVLQSSMQGITDSTKTEIYMATESLTGKDARAEVVATSPSGKQAVTALSASNGSAQARLAAYVTSGGVPTIDIGNNTVVVNIVAGLNMGSATGAADGDIKLSGMVQPGNVDVSYSANYNASLANNGVMALGMSNAGMAMIWAGGNSAMFGINGGAHTTTEIFDPGGIYSITAGTASSINVYWSAGNSRYEVENKRGSAISIRIWLHDAA